MRTLAGMGRALGLLVVGIASVQGCGDSKSEAPQTSPTAARSNSGGSGGSGRGGSSGDAGSENGTSGEGGAGGEGTQPTGAPRVRVVSPKAVRAPADGGVIVEEEIDVVCEVLKSTAPDASEIEPSSVTVQLLDADGAQLDSVAAAPTSDPDQYEARLIVAKVTENGRLSILCGASDRSDPVLNGFDQIDTFIDHGPQITPITPEDGDALPLGTVQFRFRVEFDPVAAVDEEAAVDEVWLTVGGVEITDLEEEDDGEYVATVDLDDRDLFLSPPSGAIPVTVRATNQRKPEAAERVFSYSVVIDGEGPEVNITSPLAEDVVGAQLQVVFTASDTFSEVDVNSLVITLSGEDYRYGKDGTWSRDGDTFTAILDATRAAAKSEIQISVQVSARDTAGNESADKVVAYIDTSPAIVDLDPPNVREIRENPLACSRSFDPIGTWPPEDLATVNRAVVFRSLVWERANGIEGQPVGHMSGTKEGSVQLYIQWNSDEALLRDTNGDNTCDDLREDYRTALPMIPLNPLPISGAAWFGPDDATDPRTLPPPANCPLLEESDPDTLCAEASDMTRVINHLAYVGSGGGPRPSVIFAFGNLQPNTLTCTGIEVDLTTQTTEDTDWDEGWLCAAAVSDDDAGNRGVSRPLRLCFDNPAVPGSPDCVNDKSDPPSCTDGCRDLPPTFYDDVLFKP